MERTNEGTGKLASDWSRFPWLIVSLLFLAGLVSFLDRQVINLLVDPIKADLRIDDVQVSLLQGFAFAVFYALFALPIGWLADVWSRVNVIVLGMFLWSLATILCGLSWSFSTLFIARMMVGVGEAALGPAGSSLLADHVPSDRAASAISMFASASYIGIGFSILFGSLIVEQSEQIAQMGPLMFQSMSGWQIAFIVAGLPGLVLAAAMFLLVPEKPRKQTDSRTRESGVPAKDSRVRPVQPPFAAAFRYLFRNFAAFTPIFVAMPLVASLQFGLAAWVPSRFIRAFEWTAFDVGINYGLFAALFGFAGAVTGGYLTDRMKLMGRDDSNLLVTIGSLILGLPAILVFGLTADEFIAAACIVPLAFFGAMPFGPAIAAITLLGPRDSRAQLVSLYYLVANLTGLSLGPWFIAFLTEEVFQDTASVGASIAIAAVVFSGLAIGLTLIWRRDFALLAGSVVAKQHANQSR